MAIIFTLVTVTSSILVGPNYINESERLKTHVIERERTQHQYERLYFQLDSSDSATIDGRIR